MKPGQAALVGDRASLFLVGERVYLRCRPSSSGTVSRVNPDGFRVTYDFPARRRNEPRSRFTYPWAASARFVIGEPPLDEEGP